ncbi:hypothetical protein [Alicyclobacillus sp.]|uniref:hypothetical protein n=1 Tax=Alicyclobacillus sp. TaxID=61169 RepID=UPI0025C038EA|nr:hypothetical protein [Alicyclobacillus sp.]MCL6517480.1 hypothetical protein [Alicyclobacillus sp.]
MDNREAIEQTLRNYELANQALLQVWDRLSDDEIDMILEKQQNRLQQLAERAWAEEKYYDAQSELILNTVERYEMANRHLYEHWDTIPFEQRLDLLQKQWNRLQELRKRVVH